ncbi:unnamed protein product [Pipistrellus nathusii]|uniref:Uncharacterized protein n=1 Tax=Pipistrellus nathusii TaxID=59473 RepID=A0ABP0AA80_PIPNA
MLNRLHNRTVVNLYAILIGSSRRTRFHVHNITNYSNKVGKFTSSLAFKKKKLCYATQCGGEMIPIYINLVKCEARLYMAQPWLSSGLKLDSPDFQLVNGLLFL